MERSAHPTSDGAAEALRRFASRPVVKAERCDLCGLAVAADHQHLIDPANRRLVCACDACAILFDNPAGKFTRVPRTVRRLSAPVFTDAQWEALSIPIGLAFFFISSPLDRVVAMYPGPAGATESLLPLDAWDEVVGVSSPLRQLSPDVEAVLVNRVGHPQAGDCRDYIVPIDLCYRLVGLIRTEWRGFSGGSDAWAAIDRFFQNLDERAGAVPGGVRA